MLYKLLTLIAAIQTSLVEALAHALQGRVGYRLPDYTIHRDGAPYLYRWWVIPRNPVFNVYYHVFVGSDEDEALHDHPWVNLSILLTGRYIEHGRAGKVSHRRTGDLVLRWPRTPHRIELPLSVAGKPLVASTLFLTGPRVRTWGFWCPQGWVPWYRFVDAKDKGTVGKGCAQ